ncbi:MAG: Bax inhibitor-1/YccA family protein, partial [Bauldia sp.]|nr:Bax inhibitor-1/YccA family protein [Bauldia sp.]
SVPRTDVGVIDEGLRAHMVRVYNYMASGLVLTAALAWGTFRLGFVEQADGSLAFTAIGATLFGSPLVWVIMLAPLALVFFLSFRVQHMSVSAAQTTFWVYAGLVGVSLATIFAIYSLGSIFQVFAITAAMFGAMSLWGYTTKRDLTGVGSFLFMGLIGIIIASIVNIFLGSDMIGWIVSVLGVVIFTGLTAYDTQKIKEMYYVGDDGTVAGRKAIMGALALYLDFLNLFLMLLRLFGNRE